MSRYVIVKPLLSARDVADAIKYKTKKIRRHQNERA